MCTQYTVGATVLRVVSSATCLRLLSWHATLLQALCDGADEFLQLLNLGSSLQQAMHS